MKRIFKKLLLFVGVAMIVLLLLATGYLLFGPWYVAELEIGPETTVVEGPLREDGTVDYVAAMNEIAGQGMPPEDNAFAVIAKLIAPDAWESREVRRGAFELLGVEPPADDADYFVSIRAYAEQQAEHDDGWADPHDFEEPAAWQQQWKRAREKPWSADDAPLVAEWLAAQKPALAVLSEGVQRQGHFMPYVILDEGGMLLENVMGNLGPVRQLANTVRARAMRRIAEGDIDGAMADVLTIKRLGWHHRRSLQLIEQLVGAGVAALTTDILAATAGHEALTAEQARQLKQALAAGEGRFALERTLDVGERFVMIDTWQIGLREPWASMTQAQEVAFAARSRWALNPNRAMRGTNAYFDRLVEAATAETRAERLKRWEAVASEAELRTEERLEHISRSIWRVIVGGTDALTDALVDLLFGILVQALDRAMTTIDQTQVTERLERVALAVGGYRAEHGEYPASLDDLVPEWMDAVPADLFDEAEQPVRYAVEEDRVVVYSVGPNGEDNGGLADRDDGDLVIAWER